MVMKICFEAGDTPEMRIKRMPGATLNKMNAYLKMMVPILERLGRGSIYMYIYIYIYG